MITEDTDIRNAKQAEKLRPLKELTYRVGKKVNFIHSLYERNERMREREKRVVQSTLRKAMHQARSRLPQYQ